MNKLNLQCFAEEAGDIAEAAVAEAAQEGTAAATEPSAAEGKAKYAAMEPVLDALAKRLGVEAGDGDALMAAMRQKQDAQLSRRMEQGAGRIYDGWMRSAEELKQLYPEFDLRRELAQPQFLHLLRSRVDMRTAYEVVHSREIIPAAMQYAARVVEEKLSGAYRSRVERPAENGIRNSGAVMVGSDISGMSRQEYDRVCRRIERGERVSFG